MFNRLHLLIHMILFGASHYTGYTPFGGVGGGVSVVHRGKPLCYVIGPFQGQFFLTLFPLVHMLVLFHQFLQCIKFFSPFILQIPCVQSLPCGLKPIQHIVLFDAMPRGITVVAVYEFNHLIVFSPPSFVLGHIPDYFLPKRYPSDKVMIGAMVPQIFSTRSLSFFQA